MTWRALFIWPYFQDRDRYNTFEKKATAQAAEYHAAVQCVQQVMSRAFLKTPLSGSA